MVASTDTIIDIIGSANRSRSFVHVYTPSGRESRIKIFVHTTESADYLPAQVGYTVTDSSKPLSKDGDRYARFPPFAIR